MMKAIKFGLAASACAGLVFAFAGAGWGQARGEGGGHVGGVSRAPMARVAPSRAPVARVAPRVARPVSARSVGPTRVSGANAGRARVTSFRMRRDRFGRLHRVRVVTFVGAGYPGFYPGFYSDYYPYDYGSDEGSYDTTQQTAPAPSEQYAPAGGEPAAAATDATSLDSASLILVRKDGQIVTPNAFTISGDRLVYITAQGARLSFPVAELDRETTRQMNEANGNVVAIPD